MQKATAKTYDTMLTSVGKTNSKNHNNNSSKEKMNEMKRKCEEKVAFVRAVKQIALMALNELLIMINYYSEKVGELKWA